MRSEPAWTDDGEGSVQELTVTRQNTFDFVPGPHIGIPCPCCFRDQLLEEVIRHGECLSCGADLELTLKATPDE